MTGKLRALRALSRHLSARYFRRHPGRGVLLVVTISIGVAAIVATGTLVESTLASLEATWRAAAPSADLRVANGFAGVADDMVETVRGVEGVEAAGAVLTGTARARLGTEVVDLLVIGIDLLGSDPVHHEAFSRDRIEMADETDFLVRPEAVALPRDFAQVHGLSLASTFEADLRTGRKRLYVAGLFEPSRATSLFGGAVAVMDLPAAQLMFGREGIAEAIDVRVAPGADRGRVREQLARAVAGRATVTLGTGEASPELRSLLFNLRMILGVASGLVLVVGGLVIFNAVALIVSQRKPELDVVWALGASRRSLLAVLTVEALGLGAAGAVLGIGLGALLARLGALLFEPVVGTLYAPLAQWSFRLSWEYAVVGALLGVLLTWLATLVSALGTTRVASGLAVATPSQARWRRARGLALAGGVSLLAGLLCLGFDEPGFGADAISNLVSAGSVLVLLGLGLAAPVAVLAISPAVAGGLSHLRAVAPRLGWKGLASDPGRSATVITSIAIGVAYVHIAFGVVGSLRQAVFDWVTNTNDADLIVTAPGSLGFLPSSPVIPASLEESIRARPEVAAVDAVRLLAQPYEDRWVVVAARSPEGFGMASLEIVAGDLAVARLEMARGGGAIASEHFAVKHGVTVGDSVELRSPTGPVRLRVEAIVVDYSGDLGTVMVPLKIFRERWRDEGVTAFYVRLRAGEDRAAARDALWGELAGAYDASVLTIDEFRSRAARVVDASFYIGYAIVLIAILVLIAAVVSFSVISVTERRQVIELLRSVGATRRQIRESFLFEAAVLGLVGGLVGCAGGVILVHRIVRGAMRAGGGMVFEVVLPFELLLFSALGAMLIAVLAALGPVSRLTRPVLVEAARELDE